MSVGWGTFAYGVSAGAGLGLAVVFLLNGARRRRFDGLMTSLGAYSLILGFVTIVIARLHRSSDVSDYRDWLQIFGLSALATIVALVVLVAAWTGSISRMSLLIIGVATIVIMILQVTLPNGLIAGDIERLRPVHLFGEQFVVHEGSTSAWRPVLDVYLLAVFAVIVIAIVRGYRLGRRTHSALMAAMLVVTIAFSYYDGLVDVGAVETPYLVPFGWIGAAIAGAMYLAERNVRNELRLVEQATSLEETVVERTAALIEANRRLEDQLIRQRSSTANLTALAKRFELSNGLVDPNPTAIKESLSSLLEGLGTMVSATDIELRIDDDHVERMLPTSTSWCRSARDEELHDLDDASGPPTTVGEDISIGTRTVGRITASIIDHQISSTDAAPYLVLAAEHLSGLFHRLDAVAQVADSAVEDERKRIAMELHDSVTQRMYSVSFLADAAVHEAADGSNEIAELVERIRELVLSSLAELRVLLLELRPHAFAETELHLLLEQLAENLVSTSDAEIVVEASPTPQLTTEVKTALYRISQEAISNACRHADADQITVGLLDDEDQITLIVRDDGIGFDPDSATRGAGLHNLRARAHVIGATIEISSRPAAGTSVTVRLGRVGRVVAEDVPVSATTKADA